MKKNNLTNTKLISAMLVGISAMMAMSNPLTVYAEENSDSTNDQNTAESNTNEESGVTSEAKEQAEVTSDAIDTAEERFEEIAEAPVSTQEAGKLSEDAVETVNLEAEEIISEDGKNQNLENAAEDITNAETNLVVAGEADKAADEEAKEAIDSLGAATRISENAADTVADAKVEANELADKVANAGNKVEADKAYDELTKLVEYTNEDISTKKELYESLKGQYQTAVENLQKKEAEYQAALVDAGTNTDEARKELEKAQASADALETAVADAKAELAVEASAAEKINSLVNTGTDWNKQRARMQSIVVNYYIPQVLDSGATNIKFVKYVRGYDKQDNNYNIFTYVDSNGVTQTVYFNYDRVDKQPCDNRYNNLGSSTDIVIYQKSQEEIDADKYLNSYFGKNSNDDTTELHERANNGKLDVFAYDEGGITKYLVREEVEALKTSGEVKEVDGKFIMGSVELRKVVQNKNSKVHGGEYAVDTMNDAEFKAFCEKAGTYAAKYKEYDKAVAEAKQAVEDAITETDKLSGAIDELKNTRKNRLANAKTALEVDDLATFFGLDITEAEAADLNNMTLEEAIEFLDKYLAEAEEKIKEAEAGLSELEEKKAKAFEALKKFVQSNGGDEATDDTTESAGNTETGAANVYAVPNTGVVNINAEAGTGEMTAAQAVMNDAVQNDVLGDRRGELDEVLLAGKAKTPAKKNVNKEKAEVKAPTVVTILDEEVPASDGMKQEKVSWWWLILIGFLGATGEEMYRKNKTKKEKIKK